MRIDEVIDSKITVNLSGGIVLGIDIGSRTGKAVIISSEEIYTAQVPTGINMQETADELLEEILEKAEVEKSDISYIVGTGYGRVALKFEDIPNQVVTEISCHAMGAHYLNSEVRTIIDIGGQDSKAIKVDPKTGKVVEFVMNDKCAAGTGRFLEKVAELLEFTIDELGEQAVISESPSEISSQCVVFAESEIISLRAKGYKKEDIAAGVHIATARRIKTLLSRVGIEPEIFFSGGVSNNVGMRKAIEDQLGTPIRVSKLDTIYAGALGAAFIANDLYLAGIGSSRQSIVKTAKAIKKLDLSELDDRIAKRRETLINNSDIKKVGYLCSYTPVELISAGGISHLRLFQAGDTEEVASGEVITQSVFCDFTKGILGKFKLGDPLYKSLDKVYTFYTCDCIKKVGEAISEFFAPTDIYILPRIKQKENSRNFYRQEILNFKYDIEKLSGKQITDEALWKQIKLYNQVRELLVKISELRKYPQPPLTGQDYLELIKGYYYLPGEELLSLYQTIYDKLSSIAEEQHKSEPPIRLLMSGGIIADGDRRLLDLIENQLGARIVVEDHCTGFKIAQTVVSETGDPYKALAEGYIDQSPCSRMKPLEERIEGSVNLAKDYNVDGVLYVYLKFCPCYGQTKNQFFRHFQKLGVPILELPIDYSQSDEGQLKTRLEAFIEVLKETKGKQKALKPA